MFVDDEPVDDLDHLVTLGPESRLAVVMEPDWPLTVVRQAELNNLRSAVPTA